MTLPWAASHQLDMFVSCNCALKLYHHFPLAFQTSTLCHSQVWTWVACADRKQVQEKGRSSTSPARLGMWGVNYDTDRLLKPINILVEGSATDVQHLHLLKSPFYFPFVPPFLTFHTVAARKCSFAELRGVWFNTCDLCPLFWCL